MSLEDRFVKILWELNQEIEKLTAENVSLKANLHISELKDSFSNCAVCGQYKKVPWKDDRGYICLSCLIKSKDEKMNNLMEHLKFLIAEYAGIKFEDAYSQAFYDKVSDALKQEVRENSEN